jgi:hypothetical protein
MKEVVIICGDVNSTHHVEGITAYCISCGELPII